MRLGSCFTKLAAFTLAATIAKVTADDLVAYSDGALASGWENWSWNSDLNFAATDIFAGTSGSSISVTSTEWAALSLYYRPEPFKTSAGLRFDIAGNQPDVSIQIQSSVDGATSPSIPLSAISKTIKPDGFTSALIDFKSLPGTGTALPDGTWDRITFQAGGSGATYHIDNIVLVESIVITPEFLSAEPLTSNVIAVTTKGQVDLSTVKVTLNGGVIAISSKTTYVPVDTPARSITYFTLAKNFAAGTLVVTAGAKSFTHTLPSVLHGSVSQTIKTPINPLIYGVNFPTSASYIQHLGVTISRWGGNAVTAYNPNGHFTNAGNDWYFENRNSDSADDWLGWVKGAGSQTLLTLPALDWVAKDNSSYSYPKSIYPEQQKFDPFNADAGNGLLPNGSYVTSTPNFDRVYTPWNTTLAKKWLSGLVNKPKIIAIDNEIEIASSTHQDMHPKPISYDEELGRVVRFAKAAKEAIPGVLVAAPSTCSWWFYWTSVVGWDDTAAHNNTDFLPWFLAEMKKAEKTYGKRLLDFLDIHYYFLPDLSANDDAAKALRLRMSRSLWDKTYVDESWAGTDPQHHQPDPSTIQLIPRFRTMINNLYPGTKLSISEWSSTKDDDITGGLLTVDALGIFGKYGVDAATYWATPDELGPVGLAYWLYRGYGTYFGSSSAQVNLSNPDPNTWSIFAGTESNKISLVIVNKKPTSPLSFNLSGVPTGNYFVRHFGGAAGVAKWQTTISLKTNSFIVVPPYTALFLKQA